MLALCFCLFVVCILVYSHVPLTIYFIHTKITTLKQQTFIILSQCNKIVWEILDSGIHVDDNNMLTTMVPRAGQ